MPKFRAKKIRTDTYGASNTGSTQPLGGGFAKTSLALELRVQHEEKDMRKLPRQRSRLVWKISGVGKRGAAGISAAHRSR